MINDNDTLDTITLTAPSSPGTGYATADFGAIPTITLSDLSLGNITTGTSSTYTLGSGLGIGAVGANAIWTTNTAHPSVVGGVWNGISAADIRPSGKLHLKGEEADIDINGKSMTAWMAKVEERLNILTPNPELEKEWDDLRKLGEKYRKLEQRCKEKAEVWKKLKEMPAPKVD